jgi:hypothetical protein
MGHRPAAIPAALLAVRSLIGQLERLGAVSVTDDVARLEPLGVYAVRSKLERDHLLVPVLPAPDKMTPDDLVLVRMHGSDDDLEAELASWTDSRGEEQAARELLAFAADENAATRTAARRAAYKASTRRAARH